MVVVAASDGFSLPIEDCVDVALGVVGTVVTTVAALPLELGAGSGAAFGVTDVPDVTAED